MKHLTQICQLVGDWRGDMPAGGMLAEQKMDGFRCTFFPDIDGRDRLWTRNGMPIEGCDHILYHLQRMREAAGEPIFFDGELVVDGTLAATKRWVETDWRKGGEAGHFYAFDCLPLREWQQGGTATPLFQRKARLMDLAAQVAVDDWTWRPGSHGRDEGATPVTVVEDQWLFDAEDVVREVRSVWAAGGEGIVLKHAEAGYERRRNGHALKVKRENMHKWQHMVWAAA